MMQVDEAEECACLCNADGLVSLENIFPTFFKKPWQSYDMGRGAEGVWGGGDGGM